MKCGHSDDEIMRRASGTTYCGECNREYCRIAYRNRVGGARPRHRPVVGLKVKMRCPNCFAIYVSTEDVLAAHCSRTPPLLVGAGV